MDEKQTPNSIRAMHVFHLKPTQLVWYGVVLDIKSLNELLSGGFVRL